MGKVFCYELRRLVLGKFFFGMLLVLLWYGWMLLNTSILLGVAHTAPFSPWSFGSYLSQLLPLLSVALLFFLWNQCNEQACHCALLMAATPVKPGRYLLVKCAAVAVAWLALALAAVLLGVGFLTALFGGSFSYAALVLPTVTALLPPLFFFFGIGLYVGRIRCELLFVVMALAVGAELVSLPMTAEPYSASFFAAYPLTIKTLDPAFYLPIEMLLSKLLFAGVGLLLLPVALRQEGNASA